MNPGPESAAPEPSALEPDRPDAVLTWGQHRAAALGRSDVVRSWTPLGTVDAAAIADVDPAGLVQLRGASWSLDWWVGAEDRWHHPAVEPTVRQRAIGSLPVIETVMRVPGGDVVHRCFGVRATADASQGGEDGQVWDDSAVVVEIENQTSVPVALAIVLRPVTLEGAGSIRSASAEGPVLQVDDAVVAVLSKPPLRRSSGLVGEPARRLAAGDDEAPEGVLTGELVPGSADQLEVAYVVPLPHTSTVRVMLPRIDEPPSRGRRARVLPGPSWSAPDAATVESGWQAHLREVAAVELPVPALGELVTASAATLMLASGDHFFDGGPPGERSQRAAVRAAELCDALARAGVTEPLGPIVRALTATTTLRGALKLMDRSDATVALVHAVAPLLGGRNGTEWSEELIGPAAAAVHRLGRGRGLEQGEDLTDSAIAALGRLAPAARRVGQPELAEYALEVAGELRARAAASGGTDSGGTDSGGTGPGGAGSVRTGPTASGGAGTAGLARSLRRRLAAVEPSDDAQLTSLLGEVLELARTGTAGTLAGGHDAEGVSDGPWGFDPAAVATRMSLVLDLAALEGESGPVLLPLWVDSWFGAPIEVHRLRTRWGLLSYAVRWHGVRPALLWEIERTANEQDEAAAIAPVLSGGALDPSWSAQGWSGEALLGERTPPESAVSLGSRSPAPSASPPAPPLDAPAPEEGQSFA